MLAVVLAFVASRALAANPGSFSSNSDGSLKFASQAAPVSGSGSPDGQSTWQLTMDDTDSGARQTITGFGTAVTDSTLLVYNALSDDRKSAFVNDMVGPSGGNFQLIRHTIASSDLSPNEYSYDDNNGQVDTDLHSFNLGDSGNAQAGLLAAFRKVQSQLTILGSSWHAPDWMKLSNNFLNPDYASEFAQYFVKYLAAYENAGAHIDAVTIQNEPQHTSPSSFTMGMTASDEVNYINNAVAPAFNNAGVNTKIWAYDHNTDTEDYPETVIDQAGSNTNTVAWHCYASGGPDWSVLSDFHGKHTGVDQYMTECWTHTQGSWTDVIDFTMGPLQNWAKGAIAWPMGTTGNGDDRLPGQCAGDDACLGMATLNGNDYDLQTAYYMMGQFSKGIQNGAVYHTVDGNAESINSVTAINPDGTKVLVVQNAFGNPIYLTLNLKSGGSWSGLLPTNSLTTWTLPS